MMTKEYFLETYPEVVLLAQEAINELYGNSLQMPDWRKEYKYKTGENKWKKAHEWDLLTSTFPEKQVMDWIDCNKNYQEAFDDFANLVFRSINYNFEICEDARKAVCAIFKDEIVSKIHESWLQAVECKKKRDAYRRKRGLIENNIHSDIAFFVYEHKYDNYRKNYCQNGFFRRSDHWELEKWGNRTFGLSVRFDEVFTEKLASEISKTVLNGSYFVITPARQSVYDEIAVKEGMDICGITDVPVQALRTGSRDEVAVLMQNATMFKKIKWIVDQMAECFSYFSMMIYVSEGTNRYMAPCLVVFENEMQSGAEQNAHIELKQFAKAIEEGLELKSVLYHGADRKEAELLFLGDDGSCQGMQIPHFELMDEVSLYMSACLETEKELDIRYLHDNRFDVLFQNASDIKIG